MPESSPDSTLPLAYSATPSAHLRYLLWGLLLYPLPHRALPLSRHRLLLCAPRPAAQPSPPTPLRIAPPPLRTFVIKFGWLPSPPPAIPI